MVITTCWPGQLKKMHQNGLASTVALQCLFRQKSYQFSACQWSGLKTALLCHFDLPLAWQLPSSKILRTVICVFTRAGAVWLQSLYSWLQWCSACARLKGSVLKRWCERPPFLKNRALPRSSPHLPLGFQICLNRSPAWRSLDVLVLGWLCYFIFIRLLFFQPGPFKKFQW